MAGGFMQISHPALGACSDGRSHPVAICSGQNVIQLVGRNGGSQSAIFGADSFVCFVGERAARRQPASGNSDGHLGVRICRHQLFLVGSLAAH